jgi:hypothetical protein
MRAERLANGIPLPDDTWRALIAVAREVGVDRRRLDTLTKAEAALAAPRNNAQAGRSTA